MAFLKSVIIAAIFKISDQDNQNKIKIEALGHYAFLGHYALKC